MFDHITINYLIDLGIGVIVGIFCLFFIYKCSQRKSYFYSFLIGYIVMMFLFSIKYNISALLFGLFLFSSFTYFCVNHANKVYDVLGLYNGKKKNKTANESERNEFYNAIEEAVIELSKTKTGALLTFEKGEDLTDYIEKGKPIHCKVNADLLRTIFYVGTPLHDGAVIIRGNIIEAASVYYTPTTKAMPGKFGARHRAAIGFSEQHSSVTVIISEETGRISFAVGGELIPANHENFVNRFQDILRK